MRDDLDPARGCLTALGISCVLWAIGIVIWQVASSEDFSRLPDPPCNAIYQKSTKEVLSCE